MRRLISKLPAVAAVVGVGLISPLVTHGALRAQGSTQRSVQLPPLERRVAVSLYDVSLREALDRLSAAARVRFSYASELLPLERPVRATTDTATVSDILTQLLAGVAVTAVSSGENQIVLAPSAPAPRNDAPLIVSPIPRTELSRVVVTGTPAGGDARPLSISLSVVDRAMLSQASPSSLASVLDANVPGIWMWEPAPSSAIARFGSIRGASSLGTTYPKIYIDGISVANPLLTTTIDPESVERVEVIRGPQGAALYGSDAISGVINIVTRHENPSGPVPHLRLRSTAGVSNSAYATDGLAQNHSLSLLGGTALRSGQVSLGLSTLGDYYTNAASQRYFANAGFREIRSHAVITGMARYSTALAGVPEIALTDSGTRQTSSGPGSGQSPIISADADGRLHLSEYTAGVTARISSRGRLTHTLVAGVDGYRLRNFANEFTPFPSSTDSALRAARGGADRTTLRASTTLRFGDERTAIANLGIVLEQSMLHQDTPLLPPTRGQPITAGTLRRARLVGDETGSVETWLHDEGAIVQMDLAVRQRFYLTSGLRFERNDGYLSAPRSTALPMIGASYVLDAKRATLKWHAAFGRGIRAPRSAVRETMMGGMRAEESLRDILPERQSGIEGGVDLFVGRAFSLQLTAFDQKATDLIQQVVVPDSTYTPQGQAPAQLRLRYQNVGAITNRGMELQTSAHRGPLTVSVSFASVNSRVQSVAMHYTGELRAGDRVLGVPSRTIGGQLTWRASTWTATLGMSRAFDWIEYDRVSLSDAYTRFDRHTVPLFGADLRGYWRRYDGNTHVRASLTRPLGRNLTALIAGENLLGRQRGEPDNATIVPGRTIVGGLRITMF